MQTLIFSRKVTLLWHIKWDHAKKPKLVQHRLSDEKTLVPVTVQLMDEDQVPHRNVPLFFELILPEDAPKVKGLILEGEEGDPAQILPFYRL